MFDNCNFMINSISKDSTNLFFYDNPWVSLSLEPSEYYEIFHQGEEIMKSKDNGWKYLCSQTDTDP